MNETIAYILAQRSAGSAQKILSFPAQDRFVDDPARFLSACCTRRGGKSTGLGRRFYKQMIKYPGSLSRYIALTRDSAKDIMWPALQELNEMYRWGAEFIESPLTMTLPNGSRLRLLGADMKNFIQRLRGAKTVANAIDEAQSFGPHIESLVNDIIIPTMVDYQDAWLAITGTPGPIPRGLFHDITAEGIGNYSNHAWSLHENPYLRNTKQFVEELKARHKWSDDNPTYLREWCGRWVLDIQALLIKWDDLKNNYSHLPQGKYIYLVGVDIGHKDADAIAVLAWSEASPNIYLVEEKITKGQDITALTEQLELVIKRYDPAKIVMDTGGLGLKIAEELQRRKHIPIQAADKARKFENVALLNEWLSLSKFKAMQSSQFVQDSYQVQIDYEKTTPDKIVVKSGFHSDIIDAVLYAFKESPAFTYREPPKKPKYGTPEWQKAERDAMEEAAEEHFREQEEMQRSAF